MSNGNGDLNVSSKVAGWTSGGTGFLTLKWLLACKASDTFITPSDDLLIFYGAWGMLCFHLIGQIVVNKLQGQLPPNIAK